jgi:hypothetical protein
VGQAKIHQGKMPIGLQGISLNGFLMAVSLSPFWISIKHSLGVFIRNLPYLLCLMCIVV